MLRILTPEEMRKADDSAINRYGVPGALLMENAARSCAGVILDTVLDDESGEQSIVLLCGSGNNGGDGFALARHLIGRAHVRVLWVGKEESMSLETAANFSALLNLGVEVTHIGDEKKLQNASFDCDIIIDALIGVGGSGSLREPVLSLVKHANNADAFRIALDSPTGLNVETGIAHPDAFRADVTITMFAPKTGMMVNDGIELCGEIYVAGLGVPDFIAEEFATTFSLEFEDIKGAMPQRKKVSSKFDYGRLLIVAGSALYAGAGTLCANAAITSGAGLVKLFSTGYSSSILPEVIFKKMESDSDDCVSLRSLDTIMEEAGKSDALAVGSGLGSEPETTELVKQLLKKLDKNTPVVIDADGLRALDKKSKLRKNIVLTPHTGELARLTGVAREEIEKDALNITKEWARKLDCIIVLKHVPVIITDGETAYLNLNGNPGMATAGSGDVLTGIIASLLAQGVPPYRAAALGVYLHAAAGDYYAGEYSQVTLTASAIIDSLKYVFRVVSGE